MKQLDVLHVSLEYYPAAKAGGLADVVGALPKYLNKNKMHTAVIMPKHSTKWIMAQKWKSVFKGAVHHVDYRSYDFSVEVYHDLDEHPLYVMDIPGLFDRESVYIDQYTGNGYLDGYKRNIVFQRAVLDWISSMKRLPKTLHCHDHHTGLLPFMMKYCYNYKKLCKIPTVFTIHNGAYHGTIGWDMNYLIPKYDPMEGGKLEWNSMINPLASGVKCCWKLTTVSPGYMDELRYNSNGLEYLFAAEVGKSQGVINGIDLNVWDPTTDEMIDTVLKKDLTAFKKANKKALTGQFDIDMSLPLVTFIGRLAYEKGAHLLHDLFCRYLYDFKNVNLLVLGTGDKHIQHQLVNAQKMYPKNVHVHIGYDEALAHQLYAGSDFLIMPSRVEPCGLNQMYAMRYGTIPVVNSVGGLRDTVVDISQEDGYGIRFEGANVYAAYEAIKRATALYEDSKEMKSLQKRVVNLDFSWKQSAAKYTKIYQTLKASLRKQSADVKA